MYVVLVLFTRSMPSHYLLYLSPYCLLHWRSLLRLRRATDTTAVAVLHKKICQAFFFLSFSFCEAFHSLNALDNHHLTHMGLPIAPAMLFVYFPY